MQDHVHADRLPKRNCDAGLHRFLEPSLLHGDAINTDGHLRDRVDAGLAGLCFELKARRRIGGRHLSTGHDRPRNIGDCARDRSAVRLGPGKGHGTQDHDRAAQETTEAAHSF